MEQYFKELIAKLDAWFILGAIAQICFFCRFIIQWIVSEMKKESVIPIAFWYFSIIGSVGLLIYAIVRKDPVFILAYLFNNVIYVRNLMLIKNKNKVSVHTVAKGCKEERK